MLLTGCAATTVTCEPDEPPPDPPTCAVSGTRWEVQQLPLLNTVTGETRAAGPIGVGPRESLEQGLQLCDGAILEAVEVTIQPGSRSSIVDLSLPGFGLRRIELGVGTQLNLAEAPDGSVDAQSYGAMHAVTAEGINEPVDRSRYAYYLTYHAEVGPHADSVNVWGARVRQAVP